MEKIADEKQTALKEKIEFYQKAIQINPDILSNHMNISNIYITLGDLEHAIHHLHHALRLAPFHAEAYNNLGRVYYKETRFSDAIPQFEKALRIDPHLAEAHLNLANALCMKNQFSKAITHYQEVLRLCPDHPVPLLNLGILLHNERQFADSIPYLCKAHAYDPKNLEVIKLLGDSYLNVGQVEAAIEAFHKAIELDETLAIAHHNLATLYTQQKKKDKALVYFKNALLLDPSNATAKHMINALSGSNDDATPQQYIAQLFDQYADYYNVHLKETLNYQAHVLLRNAVGKCLGGNPKAGRVLDLGCGTGLCGIVFRDLAKELVGIDLSPKMIEQAKQLNAYEKLEVCDIHEYLTKSTLEPFDLIIAGDVLVYYGELEKLFENVVRHLVPKGRFAFTIENLSKGTFQLQTTGRFAHSDHYIRELATKHALNILVEEDIILREQAGESVAGRLYVVCPR